MTAVAVAAALILLLPSPALADERAVSDPDDAPRCGALLRVRSRHPALLRSA